MTRTDPTAQDRIFQKLLATLGPDLIVQGDDIGERYLVDWSGDYRGTTSAIAKPRTSQDVAAIVSTCRAMGQKLVVQGGHTGLVGAACPSPDGTELLVSLERMNAVRAIDTLAGTAVVEAGAILANVKAEVEAAGALFPLSLGAEGSCQIGGNIATNAGGLNVVRYGMMRDLVLGLEVVLPDGSVLSDLRGLRKNNTGYDWKQLFIGAEGTLGIVTAACIKLFPKPTQVETLWLGASSVEDVMALFSRLKQVAGDLLSAFELIHGDALPFAQAWAGVRDPLEAPHGAYALVELSAVGGPPVRPWLEDELGHLIETGLVADGVLAETVEQTLGLWRIREAIVEAQALTGRHLRTDVSVPIGAIAPFIAETHATFQNLVPNARPITYGHVGDGNIHLNAVRRDGISNEAFSPCIAQLENIVNEMVDRYGGSISAEHGIGLSKRAAFAARMPESEARLSRTLKAALDPNHMLGVDRIFSRQDVGDGHAP